MLSLDEIDSVESSGALDPNPENPVSPNPGPCTWSSHRAWIDSSRACLKRERSAPPASDHTQTAQLQPRESHKIWDKCRNAKPLDLQRGAYLLKMEAEDDPSAKFLEDGTFRDRMKRSSRRCHGSCVAECVKVSRAHRREDCLPTTVHRPPTADHHTHLPGCLD